MYTMQDIFDQVMAQQDAEARKPEYVVEYMAAPYSIVASYEDGTTVELSPYVQRLIVANGIWTEPSEERGSLYLGSGRTEAKAVGQEVSDLYGFEMMQALYRVMADNFIPRVGNGLSCAWHNIGDWRD